MRCVVDNDLHTHSNLSSCSKDPNQTNERILRYAEQNRLKTVCLTDHFWDQAASSCDFKFYKLQNLEHIRTALPLPQSENARFLFGCETELDSSLTLGIAAEHFGLFDFIVIPITHFHMVGYTVTENDVATFEKRAETWIRRFDAVLSMDLPFYKIGLAHLTCKLIAPDREIFLKTLQAIPDAQMERLFKASADKGLGIELNSFCMDFKDEEKDIVLRPYIIAKNCGCKFYFGSDAHHPDALDRAKAYFERAVDMLQLTQSDKFHI